MKDVRLIEGNEPLRRRRRGPDKDEGCFVCGETTSDGKPVCIEHLDQIPEIVAIEGKIRMIDAERERLATKGARGVGRDSILVREVLGMLKAKPMSIEKIAQDLDLHENSSRAIVDVLVKRGIVRLERTGRGRMIACLT